jgi:hypothetical protein
LSKGHVVYLFEERVLVLNMKKIVNIEMNGLNYRVSLNESTTAQQFAKFEPFETSLVAGGNHCYGPIPKRLPVDKAQVTSDPHKEGVYYADHLQAIAFYYGEGRNIAPFEIVYIGEVQEGMSDLLGATKRIELKVK